MGVSARSPLPAWTTALRDKDDRWQRPSQEGVRLFMGLIMAERMPFAFEDCLLVSRQARDGTYQPKQELIETLQKAG